MALTEQDMNKRRAFIERVESEMTVRKFKAMLVALNFKQYSWTKIENGNMDFSRAQLEIVAEHTTIELSDLIQTYGLGRHRIPAAEVEAILAAA